MKNFKMTRNLWIIAGSSFLISAICTFESNKSLSLGLLEIVVAILSFINAYRKHKKIS